jgi:hypothetical protein
MNSVEGTFRLILEASNRRLVPPVGADFDRVTLHDVESPPAIAEDWQETRDWLVGAVTVKKTDFTVDPKLAIRTAPRVRVDAVEKPKVVLLFGLEIVADAGATNPEVVDVKVTVVEFPGPDSVIVQVPPLPATTLMGVQASEERVGGASNDSVAVTDDEPREAVRVALALAVTVPAVTVKDVVVAVAGTVTEAGTVRVAFLEDRVTVVPPVGAGFDKVTVQEVLALEDRLGAVQVRDVRLTGPSREMVTGTELPLREAVTVALALAVTVPAVAVKDAVVAVARTVTEAGTVRVALLEDRVTVVPSVGAGFDSVTVQEVLVLDARLGAVQVREVRLTGLSREMVTGTE